MEDCATIYERIYCYLCKYEETVYRKDYFFSYLRVLLTGGKFRESCDLIQKEIEFLQTKTEGRGSNTASYVLIFLLACFLVGDETSINSSPYLR